MFIDDNLTCINIHQRPDSSRLDIEIMCLQFFFWAQIKVVFAQRTKLQSIIYFDCRKWGQARIVHWTRVRLPVARIKPLDDLIAYNL